MKKALLTLTALSMSIAVSACGTHSDSPRSEWHGDRGEHMDRMAEGFFNKLDKNGDGIVTKAEYKEYTSKWFKEADTNHDGKLTLEEVKAQFKREKERMRAQHMHHEEMMRNAPDDQSNAPRSN